MRFSEQDYRKPRKRECQKYFNNQLKKLIQQNPKLYGEIVVLAGPDLSLSAMPYLYEDIAKKIIAVDSDPIQINYAINNPWFNSTLEMKWPNSSISLELVDVFVKIKQLLNNPRNQLRGLDLDFCCTLNDNVLSQTEEILKRLLVAQVSNFWIRLTTSMRGMTKHETKNRQLYLFSCLTDNAIVTCLSKNYKDYHGGPMSCFQMVCQEAA